MVKTIKKRQVLLGALTPAPQKAGKHKLSAFLGQRSEKFSTLERKNAKIWCFPASWGAGGLQNTK